MAVSIASLLAFSSPSVVGLGQLNGRVCFRTSTPITRFLVYSPPRSTKRSPSFTINAFQADMNQDVSFIPTGFQSLESTSLQSLATAVDSPIEADSKAPQLKDAEEVKHGKSTFMSDKKIQTSVSFQQPKSMENEKNSKSLCTVASSRTKHDLYQIIKYALVTDSAIKELVDNNTLVFVVDRRAGKKDIKDAVKMMLDIQTRKVNTSMRPDGTKKAYVMLTADYNASDVAKKIKII